MNKPWWLAGFIIIGVLLGVGILFLVTRPPRGEPVDLLPPPSPAPVVVYVSGEVNKAGLYTLQVGSRVNDAIQAAGGFTSNANTIALNLAEILEDGERITVPGMPSILETASRGGEINIGGDWVDINNASLKELEELPGIGPVTAQKIIDYREVNGPFKKIEDILEVPGIGQATFMKIRDLITVGTPP